MRRPKLAFMTGNLLATGGAWLLHWPGLRLCAPVARHADDVKFTAEVDREQISEDESVTLKFTIQSENGQVSDPQYNAARI